MAGLISRLLGRGASADTKARMLAQAQVDLLLREGNALEDGNDPTAAMVRYDEARRIAPDDVRVHMNAGNALMQLQRFELAAASYREGIRIAPDNARLRFNLAGLLATEGNRVDAEEQLREALRIEPGLGEAAVALALILSTTGRAAEAEAQLRTALVHRPEYSGAALNLGQLLLEQNRFDEAIDYMALGADIAPDALSSMLFPLNNQPGLSLAEIFARHRRVGKAIERRAGARFELSANDRNPDRCLRIGYVSGDFGLHPVGMLMRPVLEHHHTGVVEIHCYSNLLTPGPETEVLRRLSPYWHDTSRLAYDALTEQIRRDGIDILIDLSRHTSRNRLQVFARHPAPVQATWMGYLNTTGIAAMDYRICDWHTDPAGDAEAMFIEQLVRLPHSQWCYEPWFAPPQFVRDREPSGAIRFGSVNRFTKISDATADLWSQILRAVPGAELAILDVPAESRDALLDRFVARGVERARIAISGRQPLAAYYATIGNLDIALDTFPYNGGTTTLDTLWMGTPLVALRGDRAIARGACSILSSLALPELIADSPAAYVDINVRLARDSAWRATLQADLRRRLAASPLMDAEAFVTDLESCYRTCGGPVRGYRLMTMPCPVGSGITRYFRSSNQASSASFCPR